MGSQDQSPCLKFLNTFSNDVENEWGLCFVAENGEGREKGKQKK